MYLFMQRLILTVSGCSELLHGVSDAHCLEVNKADTQKAILHCPLMLTIVLIVLNSAYTC